MRLVCFIVVAIGLLTVCNTTVSAEPKPGQEDPKVVWNSLFDGKTLASWAVASEVPFDEHGKVTVDSGVIRMPTGNSSTGIFYPKFKPTVDYELELEARRVAGDDFFCGLTFPVGKEQCTWIVGGWGGSTVGLSNIDGMSADENEAMQSILFEKDRWYRLRLRVTKDKIQAWIDNEQCIDLETKDRKFTIWMEQEPMKPLGIANWNTGSELRAIRWRAVDRAAPNTMKR